MFSSFLVGDAVLGVPPRLTTAVRKYVSIINLALLLTRIGTPKTASPTSVLQIILLNYPYNFSVSFTSSAAASTV